MSITPDPLEDKAMMELTIRTFMVDEGQVTEARLLDRKDGNYTGTACGFFDDAAVLASRVLCICHSARGVYFTPNPLHPGLLARAYNRLETRADKGMCAKDHEVLKRYWLLIDLDPIRPQGIPSSDEEHELARERTLVIRDYLTSQGWPGPVFADSGNGYHLNYRIDLPAKDDGVVERVLKALAAKFDDERVKVDTTVHNPSRIWKLYGSIARKGDSIPGRPRRLSQIIDIPDVLKVVAL